MPIPPTGTNRSTLSPAKHSLLAVLPPVFILACGGLGAFLGRRVLGWFGLVPGLVVGSLIGVVLITMGLFLHAMMNNSR